MTYPNVVVELHESVGFGEICLLRLAMRSSLVLDGATPSYVSAATMRA